MSQQSLPLPSSPQLDSQIVFELGELRGWLAGMASERTSTARLEFARAVTASVVGDYWRLSVERCGCPGLPLRPPPEPFPLLAAGQHLRFAQCCAELHSSRAFFEIGELLTALLPEDFRTRHGVYYTPPVLVEHLLDHVTALGLDWQSARILDPACGGAAFLAYLAGRILAKNAHLSTTARLSDLEQRLVGIEIDPFAAWISAVLVDLVALPLTAATGRPMGNVVRTADMLETSLGSLGVFDLVIGNPPYGKLRLGEEVRSRFSRSLFGHANLYGIFTDLGLQLCREGGIVAYVTPTSFLGGEYFKRLRRLLADEAPLIRASFVRDREGVFSGVLQETMLAVFQKRQRGRRRTKAVPAEVEVIHPRSDGRMETEQLGSIRLGSDVESSWLLPRSRSQARLVKALNRISSRLEDYGYRVATGQLVWNRHKSQLRRSPADEHFPIVWAEAIQADGSFRFQAENRSHLPYLAISPGQEFLINHEPCVLIQRTTSKEQARRLIATVVPNEFVLGHSGYVVENHVNMAVPCVASPRVPLSLLARILNSRCVDEAFRCISGSVAVSAFELESLPLPDPEALRSLSLSRLSRQSPAAFESSIEGLYYAR